MNRNVLDILLCLVSDVLGEVDQFPVFLQVVSRHALHPAGNCRREQKELRLLYDGLVNAAKYPIHILLEAHIEHAISLIQHEAFKL